MGMFHSPNATEQATTDVSRFVLQLISLAGLHTNATVTTELSRAFKDEGMLAYVRQIQSREKELGVDVLTHQKWSGAPYMDGILGAIQSGSSSSKSMGEENTEKGEFFTSVSEICYLVKLTWFRLLNWKMNSEISLIELDLDMSPYRCEQLVRRITNMTSNRPNKYKNITYRKPIPLVKQ